MIIKKEKNYGELLKLGNKLVVWKEKPYHLLNCIELFFKHFSKNISH